MTTAHKGTRARLLAGAGTAVLATLLVSGAHAADTTIATGVPTVSATAGLAINSPQTNNGAVSAEIEGVTGHVDQTGSATNLTNNTSVSTEDNAIAAKAIGNSNVASIPALATIGANGAAILNVSTNAPDVATDPTFTGVVNSSVTDSVITNQLVDFATGSIATSGNTISADTTLNSGSSSISGSLPLAYTSAAAGESTLTYSGGADTFNAQGTVVVSSVQQAVETGQGTGSNASVVGNEISIQLTSDVDNTVTSAPQVDSNAISATFKGNTAGNTIDIKEGGNPTFAGSAVVTNLQANVADSPSGVSSAAAYNSGSVIGGNVTSADFTNTLKGSLGVTNNSISSAATGNEALGSATGAAGNQILLGDGMAIAGAGTPAAGANITYTGGGVTSTVAADLVIQNSQGNVAAASVANRLDSVTEDSRIGATIQALDTGSVNVSANNVTATTSGNAASNAIATGANTGAFNASVAVANQQNNDGVDIGALNTNSNIGAVIGFGDLTNADSVSVANNRSAASAYGAQASQTVAIDANSVALSGGAAQLSSGTGPDGHVTASGAATVSNLQSRYNSATSATNTDSEISASSLANDTTGSKLDVTSNKQEAVAFGASASNGLTLASGTNLGSGAGIANVQIGDDDAPVTATLEGALAGVFVADDLGDTVGGTVSSTNNLQRAIAYGNSGNNALNAAATNTTPALAGASDAASTVNYNPVASGGLVFNNTLATAPSVNANFGVLNDQSTQANVQATADAAGRGLQVEIGIDIQDKSTVANDGNAFIAAAYGNDGQSSVAVTPGNLDTGVGGGFASVANVTNVQTVGGDAAITAAAIGGNVVQTSADDVEDSSVSTSGNAIQALAYGNRSAGNSVTATGTSISTVPAAGIRGSATITAGALVTDAAFSVQNAQSGDGLVAATQRSGGTAAQTRVSVSDVTNSGVAADANVSTASATSNSAVNSLGLDANTLATSGAVQNFQTTSAGVSALIGQAGTGGGSPAVGFPGLAGSGVITGSSSISSGSLLTLNAATTIAINIGVVPAGDARDALTTLLENAGFTVSGTLAQASGGAGGTTFDLSFFKDFTYAGGGISFSGFNVDGVPSVPNQGGVTLAVGSNVTNSTLSVTGNSTRGSVVGNNASNSLTATGTQIANGSGATASKAGLLEVDILDNDVVGAEADHTLANLQSVGSDNLTSSVYGAFAIDAAAGADVSRATLSVSGNSQSATAVANTASNGLKVGDANTANLSAGSALLSIQSGDAAVAASSDAELFAPGAVNSSTVTLSDNSNSSVAVINDVTNAVSVAAGNIAPVDVAANVNLTGGILTGTATGDHVLANRQTADTSVTSTATTRLYNEDEIASATSGLVNSSLTIAGNSTAAEASANRALNTLNVAGAASNGANAGIGNIQSSQADVNAQAYTSATLRLAGDPGTGAPATPTVALNGSSASISDNTTTALARGNTATNVLNATAGATYGAPVGVASVSGGTVQATAGVLNNQSNRGGVSAAAGSATPGMSVSYQVALNGAGAGPAISNGSVSVGGNQVAAEAYGNSATNGVTLTALNTGVPTAAVGNYQLNAGAIRATATSVTFGVSGLGGASGSTLRTTGNQVSATAVGNAAVSSIIAAR